MRLQDLKISKTGNLELDIMELPTSCVIIISEGKVKLTELPSYAETKIITNQGKVTRIKWEEAEVY